MARITVTPAEEDEVIIAGMPTGQAIEPVQEADGNSSAKTPPAGQMPVARQDSNATGASAVERTFAAEGASAKERPPTEGQASSASVGSSAAATMPRSASADKRKAKDDYHETTLEDLEPTKMPFAQRVVIVAAVLCIIGALVYYFVAMR